MRQAGEFCRAEVELLADLYRINTGGAFIDVGANIGVMCLNMAQRFPELPIKAFEAHRGIYQLLAANIVSNNTISVDARHCLVGDQVAVGDFPTVSLHENRNFGASSFKSKGKRDHVLCISIDAELADTPVSLMKIDVEGMEPAVIRGARRIIDRDRPMILFESGNMQASFGIMQSLLPLGYKFFFFYSPWMLPYNEKNHPVQGGMIGDLSVVCIRPSASLDWNLQKIDPFSAIPLTVDVSYLARFVPETDKRFEGRKIKLG